MEFLRMVTSQYFITGYVILPASSQRSARRPKLSQSRDNRRQTDGIPFPGRLAKIHSGGRRKRKSGMPLGAARWGILIQPWRECVSNQVRRRGDVRPWSILEVTK